MCIYSHKPAMAHKGTIGWTRLAHPPLLAKVMPLCNHKHLPTNADRELLEPIKLCLAP